MTHDVEMRLADRYGPRAVIAGASEGIGEALAHRLAGAGLDLVLIARRETRLHAVAADVEARHGRDVRVLPLDLADPGMHQVVAESCRDLEIGLLVYAAGSVNRTLDDEAGRAEAGTGTSRDGQRQRAVRPSRSRSSRAGRAIARRVVRP